MAAIITVVQKGNACFGSVGAVTTLNTLGSANGLFATTMTSPACNVWVQNAGPAGGDYQGTVASFGSATSIGITPNATANVSGKLYAVGIGCTVSQNGAVFTITVTGVTAGHLFTLGINTDPAVTVSTVADNFSSVWSPAGAGISNATYFQRVFHTLSLAGSGTLVVTVTLSATPAAENTSFAWGEASGGIFAQDGAYAVGNGTSNNVATASFSTTGPNAVTFAWTGLDNFVSGGLGSYTGNPATSQCHSTATQPDDAFGDTMMYQVFTAKQSSITATATQTSAAFLITAVSYYATVPSPSYSLPTPSYSSDSAAARSQVFTNVKPSVAAAVFRPQASYADRGSSVSNFALESGAGSQSTPSPLLYQPNSQGAYPDAPYPGSRSVARDFFFGRFFAFVAAARNPQAVYPDAGNGSGVAPAALLPVFTQAFLALPKPAPAYPDRGQEPWRGAWDPTLLGVAKFVPPPPTPLASYPDRGNQQPVWAGIVDAAMTRAFVPPPPNPGAVFADVGNQRPTFAALWDPSLLDVSKFVPAPPRPNPSYPDRGNQQPVPPPAHAQDGGRYYFAPAVSRVWPAVFADQGSQQAPPAWRQPYASGLTFVAPVPKPGPVYPDRGQAYAVLPTVHMAASGGKTFVIPPPLNPSAVYPDFGQPPPPVVHLAASGLTFVAPVPKPSGSFPDRGSWADPPSHLYAFDLNVIPPPLNPAAVFPDRGQEPPPRVHLASAAFFRIAIPTPSGSFPDRGSAYQAPSHLYAHNVNVVAPPLNPQAVYPERGQEPPARVHLAASGLAFTAPVPRPSGSYPDRGYGYRTPATAHYVASDRVILPPSTFPTPVYPDVGMPSSWAQDMGDQPNCLFVFFLTGPYRATVSDEPALVVTLSDEPLLVLTVGDE